MKFASNAGTDRVLDLIRPGLKHGHKLDMVSEAFSLFAFADLLNELPLLDQTRIVIAPAAKAMPTTGPLPDQLGLLGSSADRSSRNKLLAHWMGAGRQARPSWLQHWHGR